ncbi:hypothetical protein AB0F42_06970 [Streptomyces buecherae]|uniref:hypothetical protein n=1 Tax=Streptomyces buecherae TaxID=2763006 RepID=UPI0033E6E0E8
MSGENALLVSDSDTSWPHAPATELARGDNPGAGPAPGPGDAPDPPAAPGPAARAASVPGGTSDP